MGGSAIESAVNNCRNFKSQAVDTQ